ncbi:hypothetical protein IC582_003306 [Cucumis melo]
MDPLECTKLQLSQTFPTSPCHQWPPYLLQLKHLIFLVVSNHRPNPPIFPFLLQKLPHLLRYFYNI